MKTQTVTSLPILQNFDIISFSLHGASFDLAGSSLMVAAGHVPEILGLLQRPTWRDSPEFVFCKRVITWGACTLVQHPVISAPLNIYERVTLPQGHATTPCQTR